jgi:Cu+-exporting ATPase
MTIATIYTCPMHPEVRQDAPGKCPKCGMNLVSGDETPGGGADLERHEPPHTRAGGIVAPKFGSAGSGGLEYEKGPERHDR